MEVYLEAETTADLQADREANHPVGTAQIFPWTALVSICGPGYSDHSFEVHKPMSKCRLLKTGLTGF